MGAVVLGMHRSGTSLLAEVVSTFGLWTGDRVGLMPPHPDDNPNGYFEAAKLSHLNDEILALAGGAVMLPPTTLDVADLAGQIEAKLSHEHHAMFADRNYVWKDPRLSITLPVVQKVIDSIDFVFLAIRHPAEIVASMSTRGDVPDEASGYALWEQYLRSATAAIEGLPTLVVDYGDLIDNPAGVIDEIGTSLSAAGVENFKNPNLSVQAVDKDLNRSRPSSLKMTPRQEELWEQLQALKGYHSVFKADIDAELSPEATHVLEVRRRFAALDTVSLTNLLSLSSPFGMAALDPSDTQDRRSIERMLSAPINTLSPTVRYYKQLLADAEAEQNQAKTEIQQLKLDLAVAVDAALHADVERGNDMGELAKVQAELAAHHSYYHEWLVETDRLGRRAIADKLNPFRLSTYKLAFELIANPVKGFQRVRTRLNRAVDVRRS